MCEWVIAFLVWEVPYSEDSMTVPMKSKVSKVVKESDMMGEKAVRSYTVLFHQVYMYISVAYVLLRYRIPLIFFNSSIINHRMMDQDPSRSSEAEKKTV